ncbi:MAG: tetratricopeptide repeat protein [Bacteroidetes bacterium]|nr:tetratricopeptide repeat protein [Bacteroidota bacterium]
MKGRRITLTAAIILVLICAGISRSQKPAGTDSLKAILKTCGSDTARIRILIEIGDFFWRLSPDSLLLYYGKALETARAINSGKEEAHIFYLYGKALKSMGKLDSAVTCLNASIKMYGSFPDTHEAGRSPEISKKLADCYRNLAAIHDRTGDYEAVIDNFSQALNIYVALSGLSDSAQTDTYKMECSSCYNNIGYAYWNLGDYTKAISHFQKALQINEEISNEKGVAAAYGNIGLVHWNQKNYDLAVSYYQKALKIFETLSNSEDKATALAGKRGISRCYGNLAIIHDEQHNFPDAIGYYQKALGMFKELGDKTGISTCYTNIGIVYSDMGDYRKALEYYNNSLKICKEVGDRNGLAHVLGNMASGNVILAKNAGIAGERVQYYKQAVSYGLQSLEVAREIGVLPWISFAAETLQKAYKGLGNYEKSVEYAELYISVRDSLLNEEKINAVQEMEIRYQTEKKQLQIENLEKGKSLQNETIARQEAENKKQQIIILSFIMGFVLVLIFSFLQYRHIQQKKKANLILGRQNEEILQKNEEITSQRDEIESQRDILHSQKEQIEALYSLALERKEILEKQQEEITDSINYAKRIQQAVMPTREQADRILGEYFILFRPKAIVSGDFYWATKIRKWLVFTVADCTGHGVPGAFMSMLGVAFLNEIVRKEEVTQANHVLNHLRENIIVSLQQKEAYKRLMEEAPEVENVKDGLDIALCILDTENNVLQFAGANNPLWIVRKNGNNVDTHSCVYQQNTVYQKNNADPTRQLIGIPALSLVEVKGDKMPVSIHLRMKEFTNNILNVHKGDCLYLFSDGYPDQFGGSEGKKFKYDQFRELLISVSALPMSEQKIALEKALDDWMNHPESDTGESYKQVDDITVLGVRIS